MKTLKTLILCGFIIGTLASCEKLFFGEEPADDPMSTFEEAWKALDENYSYFELKQVNWDSIYDVYQPQIQAEMSRVELFDVIADMANELRDGHVNLRSEFNISKYLNYYLDYPRNYNIRNLEKNYWGNYNITVPLIHQEIDSVAYIHYRSFVNPIAESDLDFVFDLYKDSKGLIIDIRENEGGNPANGFRILERLVDERKLIYRHRWVDGPQHDDFTDWEDVFLEPKPELLGFDGPVIVLTNRFCYSAANWFAAMTKAYPNIQLLGDYTGGGGGVPQGRELPNGFSINFSASQAALPNGLSIEEGVEPEIRVDISPEDEVAGIDTILEEALNRLR